MSAAQSQAAQLEAVRVLLPPQRDHLWGLCYRMTGSSADADDLVQETFRRALETPPGDLQRDLRPWLVRVAVNLCRDALRERKRRGYDGTWLPSAIETPDTSAIGRRESIEARYSELESVSFAFLLALEALSSSQRAVLLLRDVLDYSVRETAEALGITESSVKTTLHRARRVMAEYDAGAKPPTPARQAAAREALQAFCIHLLTHNVDALEKLLAHDVRARNDGGGEFFAARKPVLGRAKVIRFHLKVNATAGGEVFRAQIRMVNGMPALVAMRERTKSRVPPRVVTWVTLDAEGKISGIDSLVATRKLQAINFANLPDGVAGELLSSLGVALRLPPVASWAPAAARRLVSSGAHAAGSLLAKPRARLAKLRRARDARKA